ncbi:MAG: hypothetical protein DRQ51_09555 [Gammaproteobacteria bacterium]|nr:MAG: hypothetical protein DRQ51_09555 [Gammaproteobacteria bacterium]
MYALEFETKLNSNLIKIEDYQKVANKYAKVIILIDEQNYSNNKFDNFLNMSYDVDKIQNISREELNER